MNKLITIVTVCYNSELTIERTIKSIVGQLSDDIEYLLIDGNSKDNTLNIINKYKDNNIRVISESDRGIYDAMNKGINNAKGDWICFINSDDWLEKHIIAEIKTIIKNNNDVDCIYGDVRKIKKWYDGTYVKIEKANANLKELKRGMLFSHQSLFVNKKVFDRISGFDTRFNIAADWDFILRAYLNKFKFLYTPKVISNFTTGGACSRSHIIQRHNVRKNNGVVNLYDQYMCREALHKIKRNFLRILLPQKYNEIELTGFSKNNDLV